MFTQLIEGGKSMFAAKCSVMHRIPSKSGSAGGGARRSGRMEEDGGDNIEVVKKR